MQQYYDSKFHVNLEEIDFKIAWAVESYADGSARDDPNYVQWVVQLTTSISGNKTVRPLTYHRCTDADFDEFYEPGESYVTQMIREKKMKNLFCLDSYEGVEIFGKGDTTDY